MKILFVENHSVFAQQAIIHFLSTHQVTVVPSLLMARSSLAANQYDVLLIDYDLDDGKGEELVRDLREVRNKIRIVGVSAREEGNAALLQAGVDAICSKMEFNRIQELI
ncbi:MAG: response regulator [Limisphaerales bacterium]